MAHRKRSLSLLRRYGPWALVAGASQGLGAAFAEALADLGFNLVLVARRREPLVELGDRLESSRGICVQCIVADLGDEDAPGLLEKETAGLDLGLVVYNAAFAPIGRFAERTIDQLTQVVDVNIRGPLNLVHRMLPRLTARSRGDRVPGLRRAGIILMSSLSGNQGSPRIAVYSASKAFNSILA
ncbi:MAG: SDR family NAD(P)-dependent oxidoreductase, partial [Gemmatimonadales bacterium]